MDKNCGVTITAIDEITPQAQVSFCVTYKHQKSVKGFLSMILRPMFPAVKSLIV